MRTNRRTLISCLSVVFAVAIFVISTITTTAAETIPVSLIRPPTVSLSERPILVECTDKQRQQCEFIVRHCHSSDTRGGYHAKLCEDERRPCLSRAVINRPARWV
jgi:hypothetical protein